nr:hypothetical protein [Tanacetum cinerariifolium]
MWQLPIGQPLVTWHLRQHQSTSPATGQRRRFTVVIGGQRRRSTTVNAADHRSTPTDHGGDRRSTVAINDGRQWRTTVDCRWTTVDHHRTTGQRWLVGWSTIGSGSGPGRVRHVACHVSATCAHVASTWMLTGILSTRPDIMFSVFLCARFQEGPKTSHLEAVKCSFRYIKGTTHLGLWYPKGSDIEIIVYADSDQAGDYVDRKSTSGVCTFMGCCLTYWFLKKQTALAIFITEAEYISAGKTSQQALWLKQALIDCGVSGVCTFMGCCLTYWFLKKQTALAISITEEEYISAGKTSQQALWLKQALVDYGVRLEDIPIMYDNKGAIDLSKNLVQHLRIKYIEIRHQFLHDNVQKGNISIVKVSSEDNIANILTKPLKRESFNYLRLGLAMMEQID